MLTTMLEPYDIAHSYKNGQRFDLKAQMVSYYVGRDVGGQPELDISILPEPKCFTHNDNIRPVMDWLKEDRGQAGIFLLEAMLDIDRECHLIYEDHKEIKIRRGQIENHPYIRRYNSRILVIINRLHFVCSTLLLRANRIIYGSDVMWSRIIDFRQLYELLEREETEAIKVKEFIFEDDGDGLMEKLVVEIVVMHGLSASISNFTQINIGADYPALIFMGPPKDEGYHVLVHNHALSQIIAGLNLMIDRLGIFKGKGE